MKTISVLLAILLMTTASPSLHAQEETDRILGSWMGTLDAGAVKLRVIFNISSDPEGPLSATLDSPDQGATGIPLGTVLFTDDSLTIEAPGIMGKYSGSMVSDSLIEGTWTQAGRDFSLELEKMTAPLTVNRPQEPAPPFPYRAEDVSFDNKTQGFRLGGTLTIPEGDGPFPAVVLVSGSGPQNRDGELFGHKPFLVIADHLTRNGIAVLRYDDRGVGASGGSLTGATTADLAIDARSAFEYLRGRVEVDPSMAGIIGHSEGGLVSFMLASRYQDISFIVSLAGPGTDGKTILLDQSDHINRLSGVDAPFLEDNRNVMGKLYDLMMEYADYDQWVEAVDTFAQAYYSNNAAADYTPEDIAGIRSNLEASFPGSSYAWLRYFVAFDPVSVIRGIRCPVLALNGEKDCQVLAEKNLNTIRRELESSDHGNHTCRILPGLNHLFQNCGTGLPDEYGRIEETFNTGVLDLITGWILAQN